MLLVVGCMLSVFIRLLTFDVFCFIPLCSIKFCFASALAAKRSFFFFFVGRSLKVALSAIVLTALRAAATIPNAARLIQKVCLSSCSEAVLLLTSRYIKNFPLIELLCCTICITSAKSGAQLTTLIFFDSFFNGIESVTINSSNLEFSILS